MNFLFSRPGALSIAMNGALVLVVLLIVLFGRLKKRLKSKHWKPVTATVLRIQAVDPRIGKDTVGPRKYRLDLVFDWQGLDWHRSWYFPRTYDLPQAGDTLSLLYNRHSLLAGYTHARLAEYTHEQLRSEVLSSGQ